MSIQLKYQLEQRIDKAIKQLPYSQSKEDFVLTALNNYFDKSDYIDISKNYI